MRFSLDIIRARKGDCLIVHYGTARRPRLLLVDGGPSGVYAPQLRPRIEAIRAARGLDPMAPLPVDVLMVSHVDDDHIQGVLDLTSELREQTIDRQPRLLRVDTLWHNTFDDLLDTTPAELDAAAGFGAAALAGQVALPDGLHDAAKVLASIPQGRTLRDDAALLGRGTGEWRVNRPFRGKLIVAPKTAKLAGSLAITIVGPMPRELQALQKAHDAWLKRSGVARGQAALAAFLDESISNLSSLVLVAEVRGRRMLLTGDARGDRILEGLQQAGLMGRSARSRLHVDVLKVPHHGSAANVDTDFFARVTADHYVFSGNGEHGNPERETVAMLREARGVAPFTLHFTYPLAQIDAARKIDWQRQQAQERRRGRPVRPNWSAPAHGLEALFRDQPLGAGQTLVAMPATTRPHVIDLLQPVQPAGGGP